MFCYCCQQDQVRWSMFSLKNVSKIVSKIEAITGGGCPCELPTLQSIVQSSILNWLGIFCDTPLKEEVQPALKLAWVMYECMCVATACISAHYTSVTVTEVPSYLHHLVTYNLTPKSISIYCYIIHALSIVHSSSSLTSLQVLLAESSGSPRCAVHRFPPSHCPLQLFSASKVSWVDWKQKSCFENFSKQTGWGSKLLILKRDEWKIKHDTQISSKFEPSPSELWTWRI